MNIDLTDNMLFSSEQSRNIDSKTIENFGFDSFTLMETAALGASEIIYRKQGIIQKGLFICGIGNNAGDALAVARHLSNSYNHKIDLFFPLGEEGLSDDTLKNYKLLSELRKLGVAIKKLDELIQPNFQEYNYVVDGLFGTGISRDIEGDLLDLIEELNQVNIPVYSMDIPSGLSGDTGNIMGTAVRATTTFMFGTRKIGLYIQKASEYTGALHFIPLQFPSQYLKSKTFLLNKNLFNSIPASKRMARHKYEQGVVHILAGSEGLTGAAITACRSAWKNGAGAVFLYAPKKLLPVYEITLPEIIKVPLGEDKDSHFKESHANRILEQLESKPGILLAGPGIGLLPETQKSLSSVLRSYKGKAIIDADALSLWDEMKNLAESEQNDWLFTPHIGEATKYMGAAFSGDLNRLKWAAEVSNTHNCSIIMKGNPTFITTPNNVSYITAYNTDMFSKAGFGDQLAGSVASQFVIRNDSKNAAVYSLYKSYLGYVNHNQEEAFIPETLL